MSGADAHVSGSGNQRRSRRGFRLRWWDRLAILWAILWVVAIVAFPRRSVVSNNAGVVLRRDDGVVYICPLGALCDGSPIGRLDIRATIWEFGTVTPVVTIASRELLPDEVLARALDPALWDDIKRDVERGARWTWSRSPGPNALQVRMLMAYGDGVRIHVFSWSHLGIVCAVVFGPGACAAAAHMAGAARARRRAARGECTRCGYSLAGLGSGICPECGLETARIEQPNENGAGDDAGPA